nr:MAG TPA: hypothetical protein [Bacteriophage sp.]
MFLTSPICRGGQVSYCLSTGLIIVQLSWKINYN